MQIFTPYNPDDFVLYSYGPIDDICFYQIWSGPNIRDRRIMYIAGQYTSDGKMFLSEDKIVHENIIGIYGADSTFERLYELKKQSDDKFNNLIEMIKVNPTPIIK